jgi:hypothetical protein
LSVCRFSTGSKRKLYFSIRGHRIAEVTSRP